MSESIPAITLEIGNPGRYHQEYIRMALAGVKAVLADVGMISKRKRRPTTAKPILCERSYWLYTEHGGLLEVFPNVTEVINARQLLARLTDAFGRTLREYYAPEDGVVIGKSENPVGQSGARIVHLGIPVEDTEKFLIFE